MAGLTGEQLVGLVLAIVGPSGVVGVLVKNWTEAKNKDQTTAATERAETNRQLAEAWAKMVSMSEADKISERDRTDRCIAVTTPLTTTINELVTINKTMMEELKRANANIEALVREKR